MKAALLILAAATLTGCASTENWKAAKAGAAQARAAGPDIQRGIDAAKAVMAQKKGTP